MIFNSQFLRKIFGVRDAELPRPERPNPDPIPPKEPAPPAPSQPKVPTGKSSTGQTEIVRHFYNQPGFQTYGSFFTLWNGWATAGHVLTEAQDLLPPFTGMTAQVDSWPEGLDAALIGCTLPQTAPPAPHAGQKVIARGFPAGSRHLELRYGTVYLQRSPGAWITHIHEPDEPVVTGMSGGAVLDAITGLPIGILITRNSPADLNNDRDPDESFDFIALHDVWHAIRKLSLTA